MVSGPPWGSWSQLGTVSGTQYAPPRPLLPGSRPRVPTCTRAASSSARPTGWPRCEPSTRQSAHTQRRQRRQKSSATRSPCSGQRQPRASSGSAGPSPPGVPLWRRRVRHSPASFAAAAQRGAGGEIETCAVGRGAPGRPSSGRERQIYGRAPPAGQGTAAASSLCGQHGALPPIRWGSECSGLVSRLCV